MDIVIIGNGIAAQRAVMEIFKQEGQHSVAVVEGKEPGPYPRPRLPEYIKGGMERKFFEADFFGAYEKKGLKRIGSRCVSISRDERRIRLEDGADIAYDRLILATGAKANRLALANGDAEGIFTLRSLHDADEIISCIEKGGSRPVVIGAGLLGLEAALAVRERSGKDVQVVETAGYLLPRQFDEASSLYLEKLLNGKGLYFSKGASPSEFRKKDGSVSSLELKDGRSLECDMAVQAVGVAPEKDLALQCGLSCSRGVAIDSAARTSDPFIFAAGDVAEYNGLCPGLVYFANESARVAALNALDMGAEMNLPSPGAYISCAGIDAYSLGDFSSQNERVEFIKQGRMEAVFLSADGILKGVVAVGSKANMLSYQKALGLPFDRTLISWV